MVCTQEISSADALIPDWIWVSDDATFWMSSIAMNWPTTIPPKPRNALVQLTAWPSAPRWAGGGGAREMTAAVASAIGLAMGELGRCGGLGEADAGLLGDVDLDLDREAGPQGAGE